MIKICKYFRGKKCTNNNKCPQQLPSNPTICTSNLYYALELEQECENYKKIAKQHLAETLEMQETIEDLKLILQQPRDNDKSIMLLLAKKNEEYEGLREQFAEVSKTLNRYLKALEEVEKYIKEECNCECTDCLEYSNCKFQDILNIINKVKEER